MWWDHQNLDKPHIDGTGKRWNFRVWHGYIEGKHIERIFFWDDAKECCGAVVLFPSLHVSRIHALIRKLVTNTAFREKHRREIKFPLERHYSLEQPAFPEESSAEE